MGGLPVESGPSATFSPHSSYLKRRLWFPIELSISDFPRSLPQQVRDRVQIHDIISSASRTTHKPAPPTMFPSTPALALASAFLGVASHLTYFIRANYLFYHGTLIFFCFLLTPITCLIVLIRFAHYPLHEALKVVGVTWWSFTGALWLSMGVYRAFFHRLGGYPGPFSARLSQLWRVWKNLRGENYRVLDQLHSEYGEYVRVGM